MDKISKYFTIRCFSLVVRLKENKKGGEKCFLDDKRFDWHVFIWLKAYDFGLCFIACDTHMTVICYLGDLLMRNKEQRNRNFCRISFLQTNSRKKFVTDIFNAQK